MKVKLKTTMKLGIDSVAREARQWPPQAARAPKAPSPPQELGTPNPRAARVRIPISIYITGERSVKIVLLSSNFFAHVTEITRFPCPLQAAVALEKSPRKSRFAESMWEVRGTHWGWGGSDETFWQPSYFPVWRRFNVTKQWWWVTNDSWWGNQRSSTDKAGLSTGNNAELSTTCRLRNIDVTQLRLQRTIAPLITGATTNGPLTGGCHVMGSHITWQILHQQRRHTVFTGAQLLRQRGQGAKITDRWLACQNLHLGS